MKTKWFFSQLLSSLLVLVLASAASGQDYRGEVQGVVTDPSQAAVKEAKVTLLNKKTGIATERQSDAAGRYQLIYVEKGEYSITVEAAGVTNLVQENVLV